jgi:hypothetical protein
MNLPKFHIVRNMFGKKLAVLFLIAVTSMASFATLGDGNKNAANSPRKTLLSNKNVNKQGNFTLRSGYNFRGNQVINTPSTERRFIRLNTVTTIQKGNMTYTLPLKKKIGISNVKIDIGNRQFQRN